MSKATLLSELGTYETTLGGKQTLLSTVNTVIGQKQTELSSRDEIGVAVAQLQDSRRQLEMNEALGEEVEQSEYDSIDSQITTAQEYDAETQSIIDLLAELNKKKTALDKEISLINRKIEQVNVAYIKADMEEIAADYMTKADELVALFRQLQGLGFIHNAKRGAQDPIAGRNEHQYFSIPVFMLDACGQHPNTTEGWPMYAKAHYVKKENNKCLKEDVVAAKAALASAGVNVNM